MKVIVKTAARKYPIFIKEGILEHAHSLIRDHIRGSNKMVLITNETIYGIFEEAVKCICESTGKEYEILKLKDGEEYKDLDIVKTAYCRLIELNFHRNDVIVAFGGGVIGDTAGYIAATFHRGTTLVHVPSTIISQVDSSIGGKVAVNFKGIKNIIGCFYQPHVVIIDPGLLKTLDRDQVINGLGEVVKYGLVFDRSILDILIKIAKVKDYVVQDLPGYNGFSSIIKKCVKIKAKVVEKDEFDTGYRNLLNFGHTIGHSIEKASGFDKISHGQAVSMGMLAALEISSRMGFLPEREKERLKILFKELGLPHKIPDIDVNKILDGLRFDKKFTSKDNRFILLKKINRPIMYEGVGRGIIIDSINNCINN